MHIKVLSRLESHPYSRKLYWKTSALVKDLAREISRSPSKNNKTKFFGIGYPKTGTSTLNHCFHLLGYRDKKIFDYFIRWFQDRYDISSILKEEYFQDVIKYHEMFSDWPFHMLYKEIDNSYPGSKFILTVREDEERWKRSLTNHPKTLSKEELILWSKEIPPYRKNHNEEVKEYFKNRPEDLLVVCWEKGDGWKEICSFLNIPPPNLPFPHVNRTII